jgi:hypothetical protein
MARDRRPQVDGLEAPAWIGRDGRASRASRASQVGAAVERGLRGGRIGGTLGSGDASVVRVPHAPPAAGPPILDEPGPETGPACRAEAGA